MKSVLLVDSATRLGGGQLSMLLLAKSLADYGWCPIVLCPEGSDVSQRAHGLKTIEFEAPRIPGTGRLIGAANRALTATAALRTAVAVARRERIDIIHTNQVDTHFVGLAAARATRRPVIFHKRLLVGHGIVDQVYRQAERVIAVSAAARDQLEEIGTSRDRIAIIPNGVSIVDARSIGSAGLRARYQLASGTTVLGTLCRISREKGLEYLLRAVRDLLDRGRDVHLFVAGEVFLPRDQEYLEELMAERQRLALESHTTFLGFRKDALSLLADFDIAVLPSLTEACPRFVLEAMMMSRAIVASRVGGIPEQIDDERSGLLVAPADHRALATTIERVVVDRALRERLGIVARRRVEAEFSLATYVERVVAVYDRVLDELSIRSRRGA